MKKLLFITMLLGIGYSQDCDPEADVGYNCDCNEDTWQGYYPDMRGCYLVGADLSEAYLANAFLSDADLSGADLSRAFLFGANLGQLWNVVGADLTNANLTGAFCHAAYFVGATIDNTIFDGEVRYAYFDVNLDTYDDFSYDAGAESGDVNLDGGLDILDLVSSVNMILDGE